MTPPTAPLDVAAVRGDFPILERRINGHPLVYLDSAATSQKPRQVLDAMDDYYRRHNANVHRGVHTLAEEATHLFEEARGKVARFVGASERATVFTKNVSEAINLVAYAWGLRNLREGDEILVTEMEHHSNLVPWQLVAAMTGARVRAVPGHRRLPARPGGPGRPARRADPDGGRLGHVERARHRQPGGRDRRAGPRRRGAGPGRRRPGRAPRRGAPGHPRGRLPRLHRPQGARPDGGRGAGRPRGAAGAAWSRSWAGAR